MIQTRRRRMGLAAVGLVACLPDPVFVCDGDEQCRALGEDARCEVVGYCSEVDQNCPSGRRFHEYAGDGLAGQCTNITCGDGQLQGDEACDDGNDIDGDGCNNDCRISGQEVWDVSYASPGDVRDRCYSVAADSVGNVTVVGHVTTEGRGYDVWIRQYDPSGEPLWTIVVDGEAHIDEEGWSVFRVADDDLLVAGSVASTAFVDPSGNEVWMEDTWLGRIRIANGMGSLVWQQSWDGGTSVMDEPWIDVARDVTIAPNGDVVAIGYATVRRQFETDIWFQRRSPDGRTIRWTQHREGFPGDLGRNAQDRAHGIAVVPGGYVGVGVKQTAPAPGQELGQSLFWIEQFDEDGNTVWSDEGVPGERDSVLTAVAATPEGDVIVAGWRNSAGGDTDMWLQRRGPTGQVLWDETIASPSGDDDKANALVVDARGGFIVGGEMGAGAGSTDAWIRRYAPDRSVVWTWALSGPAGDRDTTWGVDIAADGTVYACGYQSTPGSEWDLWVRRFTP